MKEFKLPTNRSFGFVFFVVFLLIALWPTLQGENLRLWSLFISLIFLILGTFNSKILTPLNLIWMKLGILLGRIISPLVMGIIFFLIVTPIGLLMRALNKDLLNLKFSKTNSYWIERDKQKSKMKNQF
ncbi:SxtJ family membrane protein [Candidatus Pelagibacter ubique]|uniref:SxtJ family membrane protein n=1 Tax=Pelagibacter ubique TaxID=198252 RepID=UPI0003C7F1AC